MRALLKRLPAMETAKALAKGPVGRWQKTRDTIAADILEKAMTPDERRSCNIMGEEGWMRVCYSFRRPDYFQ